jgi:hypothetical protein
MQSLAVPGKVCGFSHAFHAHASYFAFLYGIATDMRAHNRCNHPRMKKLGCYTSTSFRYVPDNPNYANSQKNPIISHYLYKTPTPFFCCVYSHFHPYTAVEREPVRTFHQFLQISKQN